MSYNLPTITKDDITFGPAIVRIGATGATPSTDFGLINADDGVTMEIQQTTEKIQGGNPKLTVLKFITEQDLMITFNSRELDFSRLQNALGVGVTSEAGGVEEFAFGGDPCVDEFALQIEHQMCQSGHTLFWDVWTVAAEGGISWQMGSDVHQRETQFSAIRSTTNWAGDSLPSTEELFRIRRVTA